MRASTLLFAAFSYLAVSHAAAQRQTVELSDGWKFVKHDAAPDAVIDADWQNVSVPHCYNALDGQNGTAADKDIPGGYYRGPTWYERMLDIPADWQDKRVFVRFEAAFLVADIYLNGVHLGQHRGGFAAFCYELTAALKHGSPNELRVRVDNARNVDVPPLAGDFTMEGGIYRSVHLLAMGRDCITPLDFGGPGVYVTPTNVNVDSADVAVETKLLRAPGSELPSPLEVCTAVVDAQGQVVLQSSAAAVGDRVEQRFHLPRPHLWNGVKDPYVYKVKVQLTDAGRVVDEVSQPLGFRTVTMTPNDGVVLNGAPYKIYGVNRHQEKRDQGWALTADDDAQDFRIIREIGATSVRLAHYQQSARVHDLCDRAGLLVWQEIPLINELTDSPAFAENARQQLTEEIRQCANHPSLMTWSLCNELASARDPAGKAAPLEPLISDLNKLAHTLDPTRPTVSASNHSEKAALNSIMDWIGFNAYPGWYGNVSESFTGVATHDSQTVGGKRIAISEYGAGANPAQHQEGALTQPKHQGQFHPEEWQAHIHEADWQQARQLPCLWGTYVWAMFDFASDNRHEGNNPGVNDKGLVTEDRKIKKDAFYFYKANWNPEPMVYLTSRRMTPRQQATTAVNVYCNCAEAELRLDGRSLGKARPDEVRMCRWTGVTLHPGVNKISVAARTADGWEISDGCEWTLEQTPAPGQ